MQKPKRSSAEIAKIIEDRLSMPATINIFPNEQTGWSAVAYVRTGNASAIQAQVDQIAQELRGLYDLKLQRSREWLETEIMRLAREAGTLPDLVSVNVLGPKRNPRSNWSVGHRPAMLANPLMLSGIVERLTDEFDLEE